MLTLDRLTGIIAQGEQLDAEDKTDRRNRDFYGLINHEVTEMEGNP